MLKRLFVLMTLLMLCATVLPATAQEPVKLTFVGWGGPEEQEVFQSLVDIFNENNPDIVIEYQPIPTDYTTTLKTMIAGGTPPDIAYVPDGDFSSFVTRDQLISIQEFVDMSETFDPRPALRAAQGHRPGCYVDQCGHFQGIGS